MSIKDEQILIKDHYGRLPLPQYKDADTGEMKKHLGKDAPFYQLVDENGNLVGKVNPLAVQQSGSKVEEQLTHLDASAGTLTFESNIQYIGIYNRDTVNDGNFNVNGIGLTIPKGESAEFEVGGTPSPTVSVTGSTSYIVTRYV